MSNSFTKSPENSALALSENSANSFSSARVVFVTIFGLSLVKFHPIEESTLRHVTPIEAGKEREKGANHAKNQKFRYKST